MGKPTNTLGAGLRSEVEEILAALDQGQSQRAGDLLPLVYGELRRLAACQLAREKPGQTLQATALVHEAWLRLSGRDADQWRGQEHFFRAAAQAMRRILIDRARYKQGLRHGGGLERVALDAVEVAAPLPDEDLIALDEALDRLAELDSPAAELVKLRFFVGLTHAESAKILGMSRSTADRAWVFARAWLFQQLRSGETRARIARADPVTDQDRY